MVSDLFQSESLDVVVNFLTTTDMSTLGLLGIVFYFMNETYRTLACCISAFPPRGSPILEVTATEDWLRALRLHALQPGIASTCTHECQRLLSASLSARAAAARLLLAPRRRGTSASVSLFPCSAQPSSPWRRACRPGVPEAFLGACALGPPEVRAGTSLSTLCWRLSFSPS